MRIERWAAARGAAEPEVRRFGEALARARRTDRGERDERGAAADRSARAAREAGGAGTPPCSRRALVGRAGAAGGPGADGVGDPAASLGAGPRTAPVDAGGPRAPQEAAPAAELAQVVRVVPLALRALGPGGALALSFGRALDVELRATPAGVSIVLRPAAGLARAAEEELPRLVAALRVRGVSVAGAGVRPRAQPGAGRVDGRGGLR